MTWPPPRSFLPLPDDGNYLSNKCVLFTQNKVLDMGNIFLITRFNFSKMTFNIFLILNSLHPYISFLFIQYMRIHSYKETKTKNLFWDFQILKKIWHTLVLSNYSNIKLCHMLETSIYSRFNFKVVSSQFCPEN